MSIKTCILSLFSWSLVALGLIQVSIFGLLSESSFKANLKIFLEGMIKPYDHACDTTIKSAVPLDFYKADILFNLSLVCVIFSAIYFPPWLIYMITRGRLSYGTVFFVSAASVLFYLYLFRKYGT